MKKRAVIIVLDSCGIGAMPDAAEFGDEGCNTLGHIVDNYPLSVPNMAKLGLGHITGSRVKKAEEPLEGACARCAEVTHAKDTTCGHWEMAGLIQKKPFMTFPNGFPAPFMEEFEKRAGRGTLGNCVASGTEIIKELGDEHVKTGKLIIYTSADSVFQIAAHEDVVPLEELYRICMTARELLNETYPVGRVIARPFTGKSGSYTRTEHRRDYAVEPPEDTILDSLHNSGREVVAVGKIEDIFCHRGIDVVDHTTNNPAGIEATIRLLKEGTGSFIFTNLVDTDALYGHRRDVPGYAKALEYFDAKLPEIRSSMKEGDILFITADHGCDPAFKGTDHTREYIPLLICGDPIKAGVNLGTRKSFADIASTVHEYLTGTPWTAGESFLEEIAR